MLFLKEDKVFSLSKAAATVPRSDVTALFQEFYCYLLVAGLFREGEGTEGVHFTMTSIGDQNFTLDGGSYSNGIARQLMEGLKIRYKLLMLVTDLNDRERSVLQAFNGIFNPKLGSFFSLTGKDILGVAAGRNFSSDMMTIARYVSVAFGQSDYCSPVQVPRLYISVFGNIHLAKPENDVIVADTPSQEGIITLEAPLLRYGSRTAAGDEVTVLWSLLSAQITSLTSHYNPGMFFGDMLSSFTFLGQSDEFEKQVPAPRFASSLYLKRVMGIDRYNPVCLSASFYRNFLYGKTDTFTITRQGLLTTILNLMMEKMGETHLGHLFSSNSFYQELATAKTSYGKNTKRPAIFQYALEALDLDDLAAKDPLKDDLSSMDEDPERDPQTDDGGYDPSSPPPAPPVGELDTDKNTIGLISFDKSGEGVDENLYREAVVALNDRLQSDDTLLITAEVKDTLNQWVGGYLYRTAISGTKDLINSLKLQKHLKDFNT